MNGKVEDLIKQGKELEKQMRDAHLISLGLIDESKSERQYVPSYFSASAKLDTETNKYYFEEPVAIKVTDEEYEEICKYYSPKPQEKEILKTETTAEKTLNIIAIVVLLCGIICTLICLFSISFVADIHGNTEFNAIGFIISIGVLLTSLTIWSVLRVFYEIAINARQINNKIKSVESF